MSWEQWTSQQILDGCLPLAGMLTHSLYYPSSAFDGLPVQAMSKETQQFVYADYGQDAHALEVEIKHPVRGFRGYHVLALREVSRNELAPASWRPPQVRAIDGDPSRMLSFMSSTPFARWAVFERDAGVDETHGPMRFSLLYICGDGAATYDALYRANGFCARYVAIIQPGHGFGGNWTNYEDRAQILARIVMDDNKAGRPEFLLYGGWGYPNHYEKPCWPEFSQFVRNLNRDGRIKLWRDPDSSSAIIP